MADKSFGVKQLNLIGSTGTPTIESPSNLNLNAGVVAISTDATVLGLLMQSVKSELVMVKDLFFPLMDFI